MESANQLWIVSHSCFEASRRDHILSDMKHSERDKSSSWIGGARLVLSTRICCPIEYNFRKHRHQTKPLCDHDGSRQKQNHLHKLTHSKPLQTRILRFPDRMPLAKPFLLMRCLLSRLQGGGFWFPTSQTEIQAVGLDFWSKTPQWVERLRFQLRVTQTLAYPMGHGGGGSREIKAPKSLYYWMPHPPP